ncbi:calcium:proton antiporter [Sphingomonas quercus]|uniref:Ionic transporter y4hA n=1 Tax=Sphingomonas quercus TaxID=2842451 RepID=A0ABS6BMF1_9SPHN|nr:ionic transporter y4hA [Sphingomonas quercus]MBU3079502.1 ionic transporter y4hA [Sphingomonas quercus]
MKNLISSWVWAAPLAGLFCLLLGGVVALPAPLLGLVLIATVLAAVHHAELIAHKVGEPFGTFLLALAVTVIEVGLILTLMLQGKAGSETLARDTVYSAVMIILNGLVGICIFIGALRHREQTFQQAGVSASLATLSTLTVLTLVLPNFAISAGGPFYAPSQLAFVAIVSLLLYLTFVSVQTIRHRDYFLPPHDAAADLDAHAPPPDDRATLISAILLVACLAEVVLLAKALAPAIERAVAAAGAPHAVVGVVIAGLVLLPESVAATRAALANRLQTSLNLALGSALATIGLTIPAVAGLSLVGGFHLALGLDARSTVLLFLTLLVAGTSLAAARTTVLQGAVHLVIFGVFVFTTLVP